VVAFGYPLPFCLSLLLLHGSPRMSLRARNRHAVHSSPPFVALYAHRFYSPRCEPIPLECLGAYCPYPIPVFITSMPPITSARSLMARASLFFNDQVQSLAHTHVGSSPIVGLFLDKLLAFCLFPSPIGYTESFSPSLLHGPPRMSLRARNPHRIDIDIHHVCHVNIICTPYCPDIF
jgi:hypothetical protein